MKTSILLATTKRLPLLTLLTGLLAAVSAGPAMANRPTPVTCGSVITAPGEYFLASDCSGAPINILASHVHLKLNGHTITGGGTDAGITLFNVSHVHVEGPGTVKSYEFGVGSFTASDSHVERVTCINNDVGLEFFSGSTNNHVNNNVFSMNGSAGLAGDSNTSDNRVDNNQVNNNSLGIHLVASATDYHVNGNTALGNGVDLEDDNANCDDNKWDGNRFVTANQSCIH